jgi:hypothetical protein
VKKFMWLTVVLLFAISAHAQTDFSKLKSKQLKWRATFTCCRARWEHWRLGRR